MSLDRSGTIDVKPHAYDPVQNPELFDGVLMRRTFAFVIDLIIIALPVVLAGLFIFLFGIVTFGLGWLLFWLLHPAAIVWALAYWVSVSVLTPLVLIVGFLNNRRRLLHDFVVGTVMINNPARFGYVRDV